jgi:hypothetical protein
MLLRPPRARETVKTGWLLGASLGLVVDAAVVAVVCVSVRGMGFGSGQMNMGAMH